ncbi:hypothetical protein J5X84_13785 [Streptosporangiaceae bacterium NEAU-GS5]|nr:hypothetical protein [Streptosporangiaceae bacterium NEAU-GS5]
MGYSRDPQSPSRPIQAQGPGWFDTPPPGQPIEEPPPVEDSSSPSWQDAGEQLEYDPEARGPLWKRPLVLLGAGAGLVAALFLGLWYAGHNETPAGAAAASPTPTATSAPEVPGGTYGYAGSRKTDPVKLGLRELFPAKKVGAGAKAYLMTVNRNDKNCANAVTGDKLTKALKDGGCNQLIRASFRNAKGTIIGTIGVANLKTSAAARKVSTAGAGSERKDFLRPLPGKDTITKFLGQGEAYAGGWIHGHYAVLLWFQFKDGHLPSKTEVKQLNRAALDITNQTVFSALDTRSLTGGHN